MLEAAFRALVENAPDGIVVSRHGIVLYANAAAARLLGHEDGSELVGKPMTFLDARSLDVMRRRIEQMIVTGEPLVPREYPARRRDGTEITAEISSTVIELEGTPAVLAYARDVTERTRLRAQLAHADRLAALGIMAAGVAHEINNPLTFIGLATEMLRKRVGEDAVPFVDEVRTGVDRITAIVQDLRFFGRDEEEVPGPVDLGATIDAAERLAAHEIRPRGKLVKEYGTLPAINGTTRRIEQVFVNVFLNAAHALDERTDGRIVVRAQVNDEHVIVSVEDDGVGIPAEMLATIFQPFFTTRASRGGVGLGLSICRDIVVRAGGNLTARSTVGKGTTMEITLARAQRAAQPQAVAPPLPVTARSLRILIVDDEPLIVRALVTALSRLGTCVGETASDRALALILADPAFDVIVCDVMMPGMTGADLHERVSRERPGHESRFVFVTGGTYTARTRDYLERVPNERLTKPFDVATLVAAVSRVAALHFGTVDH